MPTGMLHVCNQSIPGSISSVDLIIRRDIGGLPRVFDKGERGMLRRIKAPLVQVARGCKRTISESLEYFSLK